MKNKKDDDKDGNMDFILVAFACIIIIFIIYKFRRNFITNDIKYGVFTDPITTQCTNASGICTEYGTYQEIKTCIPNPITGLGCLNESGNQVFGTIVETKTCLTQCINSLLQVEENKEVRYLDVRTGLDVNIEDYNCYNENILPYTLKSYQCINKDSTGLDSCNYICGNDSTLKKQITLEMFPQEYDISSNTNKYVCYAEDDIGNLPYDQLSNYSQGGNNTLPLKCYTKNKLQNLDGTYSRQLVIDFSKLQSPSKCYLGNIPVKNGTVVSLEQDEIMNVYIPANQNSNLQKCWNYSTFEESQDITQNNSNPSPYITGKFISPSNFQPDSNSKLKSTCYIGKAQPLYTDLFKSGYEETPLYCTQNLNTQVNLPYKDFQSETRYNIGDVIMKDSILQIFTDINRSNFKYTCYGLWSSFYSSQSENERKPYILNENITNFPILNTNNQIDYSFLSMFNIINYLDDNYFSSSPIYSNCTDTFYLPCFFIDTIHTSKDSGFFFIPDNYNALTNDYVDQTNIMNSDNQKFSYPQKCPTNIFLNKSLLTQEFNFINNLTINEPMANDINFFMNSFLLKYYEKYTQVNTPQDNIVNGFSVVFMKFKYFDKYNYSKCEPISSCTNFDFTDCTPGNHFFMYLNGNFYFYEIIKVDKKSSSYPDGYDMTKYLPDSVIPTHFLSFKQIPYPKGNIEIPLYDSTKEYFIGSLFYMLENGNKVFYNIDLNNGSFMTRLNYDPLKLDLRLTTDTNFFIIPMKDVFVFKDDNVKNKTIIFKEKEDYMGCKECIFYEIGLDTSSYFFNFLFYYFCGIRLGASSFLTLKYVPCKINDKNIIPTSLTDVYGDCQSLSTDDYYNQELFLLDIPNGNGELFGCKDCDSTSYIYNYPNYTLFQLSNIYNFMFVPIEGSNNVVFPSSGVQMPYAIFNIYMIFGSGYRQQLYFDTSNQIYISSDLSDSDYDNFIYLSSYNKPKQDNIGRFEYSKLYQSKFGNTNLNEGLSNQGNLIKNTTLSNKFILLQKENYNLPGVDLPKSPIFLKLTDTFSLYGVDDSNNLYLLCIQDINGNYKEMNNFQIEKTIDMANIDTPSFVKQYSETRENRLTKFGNISEDGNLNCNYYFEQNILIPKKK